MKGTPYEVLKATKHQADRLFKEYEEDCRRFIKAFRQHVVEYLQCPDHKVQWVRFSENLEFGPGFKETTPDHKMALFDNSFYGFIFRIDFTPDNVKGYDAINLDLSVRRTDGEYLVVVGGQQKEVARENKQQMRELAESTFKELKQYLETEFSGSVHGKIQRIGFDRS